MITLVLRSLAMVKVDQNPSEYRSVDAFRSRVAPVTRYTKLYWTLLGVSMFRPFWVMSPFSPSLRLLLVLVSSSHLHCDKIHEP